MNDIADARCMIHLCLYEWINVEQIDPSAIIEWPKTGPWCICPECTSDERIRALGFKKV
jgi:hypothetical protein